MNQLSRLKVTLIAAGLFLAVFFAHANSGVITAHSDSQWSVFTAHSLIHEHNSDLSEFEPALLRREDYCIFRVHGRPYNLFPPIPSLAAVPFVLAYEYAPRLTTWLLPGLGELRGRIQHGDAPPSVLRIAGSLERTAASAIVALTTVLVFLLAQESLAASTAAVLSLLYAFATSAWSVASRSLWQHGPSMLLVTLALYLIVLHSSGNRRHSFWSSAALGSILMLCYIARPTNAPFAILLMAHQLCRVRPLPWPMLLAFFGTAGVFSAWSHSTFGTLLPPYYQPSRLEAGSTFLEALVGNLISPARGLFVFSPFLLFAGWGTALHWRQNTDRALLISLLLVIALHTVAISFFPHWWGGYSYGPRLMSDLLPIFIYLLIPVMEQLHGRLQQRRGALPAAFVFAALCSVWVHYKGANSLAAQRWNTAPISVDAEPARVWDWSDPPFLR